MGINSLAEAFREAQRVEFLTTLQEKAHYAQVLYEAALWGKKKDKENKEYFSKNRLVDRYNV